MFVFVVTAAVLTAGGRSRLFRDPGTFWHILTGDRILASGFPRTDWLTFSFAGQPWVAHEWLAECAMSLLHRAGGLDALLIATTAGLALALTWLWHRLVSAGVQPRWAVLVMALAALTSAGSFHVRPHVVSILCFAWLYSRLVDVDALRLPIRALIWLIPLFILWVNCHGAVLGGMATVSLAFAAWIALWLMGRASPVRGRRDALALMALFAALAATAVINPYGLDVPRAWATILKSSELPRIFVEHASVFRTGTWEVVAIAAVYVTVLVTSAPESWRATSILPLVWAVLTLERVRHATLFAVAATLALPDLLPRCGAVAALRRRGVEMLRAGAVAVTPARFSGWCAIVAAAAIALTSMAHAIWPGRSTFVATLDRTYWPVDLIPELHAIEREVPPGTPVMNDILFGGFLPYYAPRLRSFIDDRWELFGDAFMVAYIHADRAWLDAWISRSGAAVALAERGTSLDRYLRGAPEWHEAASSPSARLYRRVTPQRAAAVSD